MVSLNCSQVIPTLAGHYRPDRPKWSRKVSLNCSQVTPTLGRDHFLSRPTEVVADGASLKGSQVTHSSPDHSPSRSATSAGPLSSRPTEVAGVLYVADPTLAGPLRPDRPKRWGGGKGEPFAKERRRQQRNNRCNRGRPTRPRPFRHISEPLSSPSLSINPNTLSADILFVFHLPSSSSRSSTGLSFTGTRAIRHLPPAICHPPSEQTALGQTSRVLSSRGTHTDTPTHHARTHHARTT